MCSPVKSVLIFEIDLNSFRLISIDLTLSLLTKEIKILLKASALNILLISTRLVY